ncbi:MAG: hypothetical protein EA397_16695 [Deltaproteobacteria bacterium]|nr:MAG: hypothetical protein EA397_16695 [Deltaproteobacteria bacterium]
MSDQAPTAPSPNERITQAFKRRATFLLLLGIVHVLAAPWALLNGFVFAQRATPPGAGTLNYLVILVPVSLLALYFLVLGVLAMSARSRMRATTWEIEPSRAVAGGLRYEGTYLLLVGLGPLLLALAIPCLILVR